MTGKVRNPYTLDFGREPEEMVSRSVLTADVANLFMSDTPGKHIILVTGARGSGKSTFLRSVFRQFRDEKNWVTAELNADRDPLQEMAAALYGMKNLKEVFTAAKINLTAFGTGPQIKGTEPETDLETALTKMLASLKRRRKKVLIAIDGVSGTPLMKAFIRTFQGFTERDLPVYLLLTGLYDSIRALQDQETLTCLHQAPRFSLAPLNTGRMAESYERVFDLDSETALEMARQTKGYAAAFQALGYYTWKCRKEPDRVQAEYRRYLEEYVYERIWEELSAEDKRVLYAMANTPGGNVASIREQLHVSSNRFTPYRTRLIRKGIINGDAYGIVRFSLPLFDGFVRKNYIPE